MSVGYANRVIHLDFSHKLAAPELDAAGQPVQELDAAGQPKVDAKGRPVFKPSERIWVSMRNPACMTIDELTPKDVPLDPETGQPVDAQSASDAMYVIFEKLILGWRAYDATSFEINPDTGEALPQPLLPVVVNIDHIRRLPSVILNKVGEQITGAASGND